MGLCLCEVRCLSIVMIYLMSCPPSGSSFSRPKVVVVGHNSQTHFRPFICETRYFFGMLPLIIVSFKDPRDSHPNIVGHLWVVCIGRCIGSRPFLPKATLSLFWSNWEVFWSRQKTRVSTSVHIEVTYSFVTQNVALQNPSSPGPKKMTRVTQVKWQRSSFNLTSIVSRVCLCKHQMGTWWV